MPRHTEIDEDAFRELELCMENESSIYNQKKAIIENVKRKIRSGKYDARKAPKLWAYWVESGAKAYCKENRCAMPWHEMFPKPLRDKLAVEFAKDYEAQIRRGEWGDIAPKSTRRNPLQSLRKTLLQ